MASSLSSSQLTGLRPGESSLEPSPVTAANWLISRGGLLHVWVGAIKANVFAESISGWLATRCSVVYTCINLLALNIQTACRHS